MAKENGYKRLRSLSDLDELSRKDLIRIAILPESPDIGLAAFDGIRLGGEGDEETFIYQSKVIGERHIVSWRRERDRIEFTDEGILLLNIKSHLIATYGDAHRPSDQKYENYRQLLIDAGRWQESTPA